VTLALKKAYIKYWPIFFKFELRQMIIIVCSGLPRPTQYV
jgi:hypothetical protein